MTPSELRAIGQARFGALWQSALARAIGIGDRHMRRLASGESPITEGIEHDIRVTLGITSNIDSLAWPRDEWIVGEGGEPDQREYIIHTSFPRFIARVVQVNDDGEPVFEDDEGVVTPVEANVLTGVIYSDSSWDMLCEFVWLDATPPEAELRKLLKAAMEHVHARS